MELTDGSHVLLKDSLYGSSWKSSPTGRISCLYSVASLAITTETVFNMFRRPVPILSLAVADHII